MRRRQNSFARTVVMASALTFAAVWSITPGPHRVADPKPAEAHEDSVYYPNCAAARAAGAAPIRRGEPGYRPEMDGDDDGIACEPYTPGW